MSSDPTTETVREHREPVVTAAHILGCTWRPGKCASIVCDPVPGLDHVDDWAATLKFYGGLPVCESMPTAVRDHIIALHNAAMEGGDQ